MTITYIFTCDLHFVTTTSGRASLFAYNNVQVLCFLLWGYMFNASL